MLACGLALVAFLVPLLHPYTVWEYIAAFHPEQETAETIDNLDEGFAPVGDCAGGEG